MLNILKNCQTILQSSMPFYIHTSSVFWVKFVRCRLRDSCFCLWMCNTSAPFVKKLSFLLYTEFSPMQKSVGRVCMGLVWALCCVLLISVSLHRQMSHCFEYNSYRINLYIQWSDYSHFILFYQIVSVILGSVSFHIHFRISMSI